MNRQRKSILFLGKAEDKYVEKAAKYCKLNFSDVIVHTTSQWDDPLPTSLQAWKGDYIISYLSRWIVPDDLLARAKVAAINFHPASPEYPGIGCNNFALYDEAKEYGVTCHHMAPKVDTGSIIAVKRFPLRASDDVSTLLSRAYDYQIVLFYEVIDIILQGKELPISKEQWTRQPFSRKEFNQLRQVSPDMTQEEIAKRIRATNFGIWKPMMTVHGFTFELKN